MLAPLRELVLYVLYCIIEPYGSNYRAQDRPTVPGEAGDEDLALGREGDCKILTV